MAAGRAGRFVKPGAEEAARPPMLSFVADAANAMTLLGLLCAGASIFLSASGHRAAGVLAMVWACGFDWFDGLVARSSPRRSNVTGQFGAQLDSLADLVSGGVCPAVLLFSYAGFQAWALPGALVLLAAGAIRLAYFNVFGTSADGYFTGLSIDKNIFFVALVCLLEPLMQPDRFVGVLYATVVVLAALNVSPLKTPKLKGRWYYVYAAVWAGYTAAYGVRLGG